MSYSRLQRSMRAGAALALISAAALWAPGAPRAQTEGDGAERPEFCAMLVAFDRAMQRRYYNANYAPSTMDCSFIGAQGCSFEAPREIVIRVTHVRDLGCDAGGDCRFQARQVCEAETRSLYSCQTLMSAFTAHYEVSGTYTPRESGGGWRLEDWRRDPAPRLEAAEYEIDKVCPPS